MSICFLLFHRLDSKNTKELMLTVSIGFQTHFLEGEFSGGVWLDRRKK